MIRRLVLIVLALTLTPLQAGHSSLNMQGGQEVSDAQKKEFIELLNTLPSKGEFYTEEAARRAAPYLPVIFSLTEKDVEKLDLYAFVAISVGISADKERRAYAVAHFTEIRHPKLKLFWAALLFNLNEVSPEIVRHLRDALDSDAQAKELQSMSGPEFKFFKRAVRQHPFAQDGRKNSVAKSVGAHVGAMALAPDGKTIFVGGEELELWSIVSGRLVHRLPKQPSLVEAMAFSPDGKTIAFESQEGTGLGTSPFAPGIIHVWDVTTPRELYRLSGHQNRLSALVFSSDGKWLASGSWDHTVKLWDVTSGKLIRSFPAERKEKRNE